MTIEQIISKYNGKMHDANDFWSDGALDPRERIVELHWDSAFAAFQADMNVVLDANNPIQYISDEPNVSRFFLYYAV